MKENFCYDRFCLTLRQIFTLKGSKIFAGIGIELAIILGFILLSCFNTYRHHSPSAYDPAWNTMEVLFWIGLTVTLCYYGSRFFNAFSKKATAISLLMLPASQLEKYLAHLLIYVLMPIGVFLIGFEIVDLLRVLILNIFYLHSGCVHLMSPARMFSDFCHPAQIAIFTILFCQSAFVLGSALWPRRAIGATFCTLLVLGLVFIIWDAFLVHILPYRSFDLSDGSRGETLLYISWISITGALIIFNYVMSYFRLKEAEIINHL